MVFFYGRVIKEKEFWEERQVLSSLSMLIMPDANTTSFTLQYILIGVATAYSDPPSNSGELLPGLPSSLNLPHLLELRIVIEHRYPSGLRI